MMQGNWLLKLWSLTAAAILVVVVWQSFPLILGRFAEPRIVAARGELAADEQATIEIFQNARDSVVFITTSARMVDPWTRSEFDVPRGSGSGFVWNELGHVVTNNHVIEGASRAIVRLADGRAFPAYLIGTAPDHDLAVLRIDMGPDRPPPIPVGTSADLKVGQKVFAIGNPFGLDWTMTTGIVSALERELPTDRGRPIRGLIQTDAAINPGNSGGPLIDSAGRMVGVNTAIYSPSGGSAGVGFAVPADVVNRVVPQLIATGRYSPPSLGILFDARADEMLRQQGMSGVPVLGLVAGSGAEAAGLQPARVLPTGRVIPGDVIVALDDTVIETAADLLDALDRRRPGDQVTLGIVRNRRRQDVPLVLQPSE